jgi:photosystem II stability/assembly factor-like uncharacterized protein
MKKSVPFILLIVVFACSGLRAQDWVRKMQDPNVNFYEVQKSFNTYWEKTERRNSLRRLVGAKELPVADENYEMYKRWEYFTEPRVYPSGDRSLISKASDEMWNYKASRTNAMQMASNWTLLGPTSSIPAGGGGAGRVNCVAIDPVNPQTIYVGAPVGGLWKSTNGGTSWTTTTDHLPVIGVSDILIDPTNTNVIYISSGDADHSDSYSCGVLKSTDGGLTWSQTGLSYSTSGSRMVYCLLMNPSDHTMLFAGTSNGLYKSTDSGVTWTKVLTAGIRDMEFKPADPTTIYAVSNTAFYRSLNTGKSFSPVTTGLPTASAVSRLSLATTAADPNYLYVLASTANGYYYQGLYLSTNAGTSFTSQSNSPNLLGFYSGTGGDATSGQGWYTLSVAASPINKMEVVVGGVNIWRSTNAGASWAKISNWTSSSSVHADVHDLRYVPGTGTFYAGADGGCFRTTNGGASWTNLSNGLQIAQMYRIGCAQTDPNVIIQGWQDNGTNEYNTGSWSQILGGDGMDCFIDYTNANTMYATNPNGSLYVSVNGGGWQSINSNITGTGSWVTPWGMDPVTPTTIYAGFQELWKSTNRGASWTAISTFGLAPTAPITSFALAKSNPQYIYASNGSQFYGTTNGGTAWTNLSSSMPGSNTVTAIDVSTTNPSEVWITYSGYSSNAKVFRSVDAGHTWTNIASLTLPNMPVNCIVTQPGSADGVYVGTDVGVYYKDSTMTSWAPFMNGLPNVNIAHLQIQTSSKKLRAGTFGRGLWETNLFDPASTAPLANFTANITTGCPGTTVQFTDLSTNGATAWNWTFQGGTPPTSNLQNPAVSFSNPGTYNYVKLVVTNAGAQRDSVTRFSYIAISPQTPPSITLSGKDTVCSGQTITLASSLGNSYSWSPNGSTLPIITPSGTGNYAVTVTDIFGCASTSAPMHVVINPIPLPNITQSGDTLFSSYTSGNQWYKGGVLIPGATGPTYVMNGSGVYTVHVTSAAGCTGISNTIVGIREDAALQNSVHVFPNPNDGRFVLGITLSGHVSYTLRISDVTGREVYSEQFAANGSQEKMLDLSTFGKGVYLLEVSGPKGKAVKKVIVY